MNFARHRLFAQVRSIIEGISHLSQPEPPVRVGAVDGVGAVEGVIW